MFAAVLLLALLATYCRSLFKFNMAMTDSQAFLTSRLKATQMTNRISIFGTKVRFLASWSSWSLV